MLDLATLRKYLSLGSSSGDTALLQATLDAAVAACGQYTGRTLGDTGESEVVQWVSGSVVRVPDLRTLEGVEVLDGDQAGEIDPVDVELMWSAPHPWVRLPDRLLERSKVRVTGAFGMNPIPADLLDSIYVYAARRWRERDAMYSDVVQLEDGAQAMFYRQLPASVRVAWDAYRVPPLTMASVQVRRG